MAHTLPTDVLYSVFLNVGPSRIREVSPKVLSLSPMNVSLVCRSWRACVAENSSLWGRLEVDIRRYKFVDQRLRHVVETWLRNSASAPLSFSFSVRTECASREVNLETTTSLLLSQAHRWKDMVFQIDYPFLEDFLSEISLPSTPSLTSLWIGCGVGSRSTLKENLAVSLDLSLCQQIKDLIIRFGVKLKLPGEQPIRLEHLTRLGLYVDVSVLEDFRAVLAASLNLTELDVALTWGSGPSRRIPDIEPTSLLLPNLTLITFIDECHALLTLLLSWLNCPKLRRISAENTYSHSSSNKPGVDYVITRQLLLVFEDFFQRSRPPLAHLELRYGVGRQGVRSLFREEFSETLRRVLHHLNDLKSLHLEGLAVDDQLIQELIIREDETEVSWPLLEEIHMVCIGHGVLSQTVADMIVSRCKFGKLAFMVQDISGVGDLAPEFPLVEDCVKQGLIYDVYPAL